MAGRGSAPGERRGGRKKGVPNKITRELRAAIQSAFEELGGDHWLAKVGKKQPAVLCKLLGQTLPKDVNVRTPEGLSLSISLSRK